MVKNMLILMAIVALFISAGPCVAEDAKAEVKYDLGKVLVTATKTQIYQFEVGSSASVITAEELKKKGKTTVLEVLRTVPGVAIAESGSFGGSTSLYLRGAKPGHTLVLIDGIEVNDPMAIDRSFDFAHLSTDNIERIEIIRGPQSTLYGSDAIGGVINIITKKGEGKTKFELVTEGGSHNTFKQSISSSSGTKRADIFLSYSHLESDGISKAKDGAEKDGYSNSTFSSRLGYKISDDCRLGFVLRYTDTETDIDDTYYDDDPNYTAWRKNLAGRLSLEQAINSWWDHRLSFYYTDVRRKYRDEKDHLDISEDKQSWYKGDNKRFEWQNNFSFSDLDVLTLGLEYEEERGTSLYRYLSSISKIDRRKVNNKAYYLQNQFKLWKKLFTTLGFRVDDHQVFGLEPTYKLSTAYIIPQTATRLKGNWGTGFKAPSIYQLYSSYGDPNLKPDESRSYDFGFEQNFLNGKISFGATYFHNEFKNMIDYDWNVSKYQNIANAEAKGGECELTFQPQDNLSIGANYTYTKTKDKDTGLKLGRRPRHQVGLDINFSFLDKGNLNLSADYLSSRWDNNTNTHRLKQYIKADLFVSYDFTETFQIFANIKNLLDREFQQIYGYAVPGISFYGGCKIGF